MELVKEYVNLQPKKDSKRSFYSFNRYDIGVSIDGQEIGTVQAIPYYPEESRNPLILGQHEGSISAQNIIVHPEAQSLFQQLLYEEMRSFSMSLEENIFNEPNREERRMKPSHKKGEEYKNEYRKGLHNMLGRKKSRWS